MFTNFCVNLAAVTIVNILMRRTKISHFLQRFYFCSLYAKYYFALRSLLEKSGFRDRYNQMVGGFGGIAASEAIKVSKRSEAVKEEALLQLSRSM